MVSDETMVIAMEYCSSHFHSISMSDTGNNGNRDFPVLVKIRISKCYFDDWMDLAKDDRESWDALLDDENRSLLTNQQLVNTQNRRPVGPIQSLKFEDDHLLPRDRRKNRVVQM